MSFRHALLILPLLAASVWGADAKAAKPVMIDLGSFSNQLDGWSYYGGWEVAGAMGTLTRDGEAGHTAPGAARLNGDFTNGGFYVGMRLQKIDQPVAEFAFWVKPEAIEKFVGVRLTDEAGQTFVYNLRLALGNDWQRMAIEPGVTAAQSHYGGPKDGKWQGKLTGAMISLTKHECKHDAIGSCLIDDITITKPKP